MVAIFLSVFLVVVAISASANAAELTGAEIIDAVSSDQWDDAVSNKIMVTINENPTLSFVPKDLSLVAGTAYVLRVDNNVTNSGKHYYSAPGLFASSAMRKIQTAMAEMKADFLGDVELLVSSDGTTSTWVEYYFVPMIAGSYEVVCTIGDHAILGMNGTITVTDDNNIPDTLITDFSDEYTVDTKTSLDPRRSSSDPVWRDVTTVEVEIMSPNDDSFTGYAFRPSNVELILGKAYILKLFQVGNGVDDKHYYTAPEFYKSVVTRKLQDSNAEVKFPYINAVELTDTPELAGQRTFVDVYLVPTIAGSFETICTIEGHAAAGMNGTITVVAGGVDTDGASNSNGARLTSVVNFLFSFMLCTVFYFES